MKVRVAGWAYLPLSGLSEQARATLKARLTIFPKKVGDHPGDAPAPVKLFREADGFLAIPRQYFLTNKQPHHEIELDVTTGRADMWPGPLKFSGTLRDDQKAALKVVSDQFRTGSLGGIVRAVTGWGKCLTKSTVCIDGETGEKHELGDLVGRTPAVLSLTGDKVRPQRASKVWASGTKSCVKLTLASGQFLEASVDHPVLTPQGYRTLEDLTLGDFVAVARSLPEPPQPLRISDAEVLVAAALMADGALAYTGTAYIKGDRALVDSFLRAVTEVPGFAGISRDYFRQGAHYVFPKGLTLWTEALGLRTLSKEKRVPPKFFGLSDEQLALFLRWLWTDGNVYVGTPRKLELCLASEGLIDDVQLLLRRFGVVARKSYRPKSIKQADGSKRVYPAWRLQVADAENIIAFLERVGTVPGAETHCVELLRQAREALSTSNTNWDVVPFGPAELEEVTQAGTGTWRSSSGHATLYASRGSMGRTRFLRLCVENGYEGPLRKLAEMDVVWERVKSLVSTGEQAVFDLTVPETQNVIANGLVVHNTTWSCGLIAEMNVPTLVVVHKEFLLNQWKERIAQFLPDAKVGLVQQDSCDFQGKHIVIGMVHSLAGRDYGPLFQEWPGLVITDEVHRIGAETWAAVPPSFKARYRLGVSATPRRKDGADNVFYYHIGSVLYASTEQRMKPKIRKVWTPFHLIQTASLNPNLVSKTLLLKFMCANKARNKAIVAQMILAVSAGRKLLVLSERLKHLADLEAELRSQWKAESGETPTVGYYVGGMGEEELEEAAKARVIFATVQFASEGLDIPALDTAFLTVPMGDVEQAVGRILRPCEGKKDPVVVDFRDEKVGLCVKAGGYRDRFYEKMGWVA